MSHVPEGCCYPDCFNCPLEDCYAVGIFPGELDIVAELERDIYRPGVTNKERRNKKMHRERQKKYYHSEKGKARSKKYQEKYRKTHREKNREYQRRYYYRMKNQIEERG